MNRIRFFVHPIVAIAIALMAVNDHYLKFTYPSWLTGKLSDFLGLFYFPLFLSALWCLYGRFTRRVLIVSMALTAIVFASIKIDPRLTQAIAQEWSRHVFAVRLTNDPSDLFALLSFIATYFHARRYFET